MVSKSYQVTSHTPRQSMEIIGLFLAAIGILFAFEMPRSKFLRFFGYKTSSLTRTNHSLSNHDRKLVKIFRSLFAEPGLIQIYQQHDFLLPLKRKLSSR